MSKKEIDARITAFTELVNRGIEAWSEAGRLLCELLVEDPLVRQKIIDRSPWMSDDVLTAFERMGRKEIYPYLLLDHSAGSKRLIQFDYEQQRRLYAAKISVATMERGEIVVRAKRLQELTKREVETAFSDAGLRPIQEQRALLRPKAAARENAHSPDGRLFSEAPPDTAFPSAEEALDTYLERAQSALILARELMDGTKPGIDAMMTKALNAVGELRFALHDA